MWIADSFWGGLLSLLSAKTSRRLIINLSIKKSSKSLPPPHPPLQNYNLHSIFSEIRKKLRISRIRFLLYFIYKLREWCYYILLISAVLQLRGCSSELRMLKWCNYVLLRRPSVSIQKFTGFLITLLFWVCRRGARRNVYRTRLFTQEHLLSATADVSQ